MNSDFVSQLQQLLTDVVTGNDGSRIRQATTTLNQNFYNKPECVPALMQILVSSPAWELRQMAAVELRKRSTKWWPSVDGNTQEAIKKSLLDFALAEKEPKVRHSAARVISCIAKIDVPAAKWNNLLQFLYGCCQSQQASHREVGYYVIFTLLDVVAESFAQHMHHLISIFEHGLNDPESQDVKTSTLRALGRLAELIEPEDEASIKSYRRLVPGMVAVLQQFLQANDEHAVGVGIEVFDALVALETPLISKHVADLVQFFLSVCGNKGLTNGIRNHALTFLMWALVYKKNKINRLKLVPTILHGLFPIGTEEDPEDEDDENPSRLSFRVMHTLAMNSSPQQTFPLVWEYVINYMQQPSAGHRKAAIMAVATMVEGCSDHIRNEFKLENVIPVVASGLRDPDVSVRRAACIAVASLAQEMGEDISEYHETILPIVFELLGDSNSNIQSAAAETLDTLLENLGEHIKPYLNVLMERLVMLLESSDNDMKISITSAIGSAAHAAEESFRPYFAHVMPRIQAFMALPNKEDDDEMSLRAVATDTAAAIAPAVGKEVFAPYLQPLMELAMIGAQINVHRLAECSFSFFGMMAKVFGDGFAPFVPACMERLFHSCQVAEVDDFPQDDEDLNVDDDGDYLTGYAINNAIAEEKETAVESLGVIFENTSKHCGPFYERLVQIVQELSDHSHESVRKSCISTFYRMLSSLWKTYHLDLKWSAGIPPTYTVHSHVSDLLKIVMEESMKTYDEEEDKSVVSALNAEIMDTVRLMGPIAVAGHLDVLAQHILNILEKKANCQLEADDEDAVEEEDDDQAEYDALVISTAADLIGALAEVLGGTFVNYFRHFFPHIMKYYKPQRPVSERSMAVGVLGEVASGLKSEVTPFTQDMMTMVMHALSDEDEEVRSNAAYGAGMICLHTTMDLSSHYSALLMKLSPLFTDQRLENVTDNACGAVSRMITKHPNSVPLDQVLPVLFRALPLKKDFAENQPLFECIHALYQAQNPVLLQHLPLLFPAFAHVLSLPMDSDEIEDVSRQQVLNMIKSVSQSNSSMFQSLVGGLQSDQQKAVLNLL